MRGSSPNVRFWPKADMTICAAHVRYRGVKRTCPIALHMTQSGNNPIVTQEDPVRAESSTWPFFM
jgi:hypothetical protein